MQAHICLLVCGSPWWVLLQQSTMLRLFFIVECGTVRFFCAVHVFEVWASWSSPRLPYLCAKFCFFRGLRCWASPWRKMAYSITHPAYLMPQDPKHTNFEKAKLHALHGAESYDFTPQYTSDLYRVVAYSMAEPNCLPFIRCKCRQNCMLIISPVQLTFFTNIYILL